MGKVRNGAAEKETTVEVIGLCMQEVLTIFPFPCPSGFWLSRKISSTVKIRGIVGGIFTGALRP